LIIPQFCLRFNDTDNVGITGHNVGFIMLGEHAFLKPKDYDINKFLKDVHVWSRVELVVTGAEYIPVEDFIKEQVSKN